MKKLAVVLFSGGLDSSLATRILQCQGFEVVGLTVRMPFHRSYQSVWAAACHLQIPLAVRPVDEDFVQVLRFPKHGYGRGANPCLDCRSYMLRMAKALMDEIGAVLVATGEVLGQRPMSQKRRDLGITAHESGLEGRLLRPLSAKLLPPTIPEQEGLVDRDRLYDFTGRSRKPLRALARELGLKEIPESGGGCMLTEVEFAPKVWDLLDHEQEASLWDCQLLTLGRHFRLDQGSKLVLGRNEVENLRLQHLFAQCPRQNTLLLTPVNFVGPQGLLIGETSPQHWDRAVALLIRYVRRPLPATVVLEIRSKDEVARAEFQRGALPEVQTRSLTG